MSKTFGPPSFLFATSGSGKSYYEREIAPKASRKVLGIQDSVFQVYTSLDNSGVLDGDELVRTHIGWPKGEWWEELSDEELRDFIGACYDIVLPYAKNHFVVFGVPPVDHWHAREIFNRNDFDFDQMMILAPSLDLLERNMEYRTQQLARQYRATGEESVKPTDPALSHTSSENALRKFRDASFDGTNWKRTDDVVGAIGKAHKDWLEHHFRHAAWVEQSDDGTHLSKGTFQRVTLWTRNKVGVFEVWYNHSTKTFTYAGTSDEGFEQLGLALHYLLPTGNTMELVDLTAQARTKMIKNALNFMKFVKNQL